MESWAATDRALIHDFTWDEETWTVTTPHKSLDDAYFKQQALDGCNVDGMDLSQLINDKSSIDKDHAAAVEQVKPFYQLKGDEEMDSHSGASACTGATHSTGGDNNLVRSVTTLDLKTTYKSNKVDLALSKAELARQEEEIEKLKAQLAALGNPHSNIIPQDNTGTETNPITPSCSVTHTPVVKFAYPSPNDPRNVV